MEGSCHPADGDAAGWRSGPGLYCPLVSDLPLTLPDDRATVLLSALDRERKIDAALDRLGPLVDRDVLDRVPPHVEYSLTPLGRTLEKPLVAICEWAMEHLGELRVARTRR